jgi:hypothetical protein
LLTPARHREYARANGPQHAAPLGLNGRSLHKLAAELATLGLNKLGLCPREPRTLDRRARDRALAAAAGRKFAEMRAIAPDALGESEAASGAHDDTALGEIANGSIGDAEKIGERGGGGDYGVHDPISLTRGGEGQGDSMDKGEFVEKAPVYYTLALAVALRDLSGPNTVAELDRALASADPTTIRVLEQPVLVDKAIKILHDANVIQIIEDDFGPTLYKSSVKQLDEWLRGAARDKFPLFQKFYEHQNRVWLLEAVTNVNRTYEQLGVTSSDFDEAKVETQWEPIPLDRSDEKLQAATKAIDDAIENIEADNGYAVHAPGEREYVLSNLKTMSKMLKEQTQIYWMQVKTFGIDPLTRVATRFGRGAVGVVASAAKDAIIDWLKDNFAQFLNWL